MTEKLKEKIEKRLNKKFKKVVFYKNPNEFTTLYLEKINPDHIGLVWGKRHKKYNKGTHYIKCAKVFFYSLPIIYGLSVAGWIDMLTNYTFKLLFRIGFFGMLLGITLSAIFYGLPIIFEKSVIKWDYLKLE